MRLTQGTFSFMPELTDAEIRAQVEYARMFATCSDCAVVAATAATGKAWASCVTCRATYPSDYVKVTAFDSTRGFETTRLSFVVQRPPTEAGFALDRTEDAGRSQRYAMRRKDADGQTR